jgi:endoglucanase
MVGSSSAYTNAMFQDFWARMAARFSAPNLIYEIANEPVAWDGSAVPIADLIATTNAAIAGIRSGGARNLILFNLNGFGTYGWRPDSATGPDNRANVSNIIDPLGNTQIDMHHYLDKWGPGQSTAVAPNQMDALIGFTTFARANGLRAFLGEFGSGADVASLTGLAAVVAHVEANRDVWSGWAYWEAVAYQEAYIFQVMPTELTKIGPFDVLPRRVTNRSQMNLLAPAFVAP